MMLAFVSLPGRGANDAFLADVTARLGHRLRLCGTVQTNIERTNRRKCDMDLRILPGGPVLRISEDRGAAARGCTLDAGVLEEAVVAVQAGLDGAELVIINKFGKQECEGRGFAPVIAEALGNGLPVLVGVNGLNLPHFEGFADGLAQPLPADAAAVVDWCLHAAGQRHVA